MTQIFCSAEKEGGRKNFVLISQEGDLQLLVPEAQHIVGVSILIFLYYPLQSNSPQSTECDRHQWCSSSLQGTEYSWPQTLVFSTCLHLTIIIHKWRQMKLQRERAHRLPLAGPRDSGRGLVRAEAPLPDLTLHDSPDVIINYWRCAVHHLDTHPLTLWLAHCEAWDTGNWPNAGTGHWPVNQSEISIHRQQPITRRQNCHPYPATSQL